MDEMDDLFNPDLLEGLDEFDDECDDFPTDSPNEIVETEKTQAEHQIPRSIIGIVILLIIIVILSL